MKPGNGAALVAGISFANSDAGNVRTYCRLEGGKRFTSRRTIGRLNAVSVCAVPKKFNRSSCRATSLPFGRA
jgi:hypothetical protein